MSKPYRIQVQELIQTEDYATYQIEQLPLVPHARFVDIIRQVLEEAGWKENQEGVLSMQGQHGESYAFDPESLQIRTTLTNEEMATSQFDGMSSHSVEQQAEHFIERKTQQLQSETGQQLASHQEERIQQFESWVTEATGRALKEIAEQLGDVQSIEEQRGEDGSYRLTISIQEYD